MVLIKFRSILENRETSNLNIDGVRNDTDFFRSFQDQFWSDF